MTSSPEVTYSKKWWTPRECKQPIKSLPDYIGNTILCRHLICRQPEIKCTNCINFIYENFYSIYSLSRASKQLYRIIKKIYGDELQIFLSIAFRDDTVLTESTGTTG